jgi:CheY-like chemotaxis protein
MQRVLVVEDNSDMGPYLKQGLRERAFAVDLVTDGNDALDYGAAADDREPPYTEAAFELDQEEQEENNVFRRMMSLNGARCRA